MLGTCCTLRSTVGILRAVSRLRERDSVTADSCATGSSTMASVRGAYGRFEGLRNRVGTQGFGDSAGAELSTRLRGVTSILLA